MPNPGVFIAFLSLILGCAVGPARADHVVRPQSYSMVNGEFDPYYDETYSVPTNANTPQGELVGGLGQLSDGVVGGDYSFDYGNRAGFEWVGWYGVEPSITFDFGDVRTFSKVAIHSSNTQQGTGVNLWGTASVTFSDDGETFVNPVVYAASVEEMSDLSARFIEIPIVQTARYVKIAFTKGVPDSWILLSEIRFLEAGFGENEPSYSSGFSLPEDLNLGGVAAVAENKLKFGPATSYVYSFRSTLFRTKQFVRDGFDTQFAFKMSNGSPGLSYVVQNVDEDVVMGFGGPLTPYGQPVKESFSVNLHTNGDSGGPSDCFVRVLGNGGTVLATADLSPLDLEDGAVHEVHLLHNGQRLAVMVDNNWVIQDLIAPLGLAMAGDGKAWVGFGSESSTYSREQVTEIHNWTHRAAIGSSNIVAAPAFTPDQGYFNGKVNVSITSATPGAEIRYTVDGSVPSASSPLYSAPISLFKTTVVNAAAFKSGLIASPMTSATLEVGNGCLGSVLREIWDNPEDLTLAQIGEVPRYPSYPTDRSFEPQFDAPRDVSEHFITRMRGYLHPPVTGEYRFWLSSDDGSELYLSTDDNPANKVKIASLETAGSGQQSEVVTLTAGQRYYIEALGQHADWADSLSVHWTIPGGEANAAITKTYLSPYGLSDQPGQLTAPSLSVPGGIYGTAKSVTVTAVGTGVSLYYTVDGSEPVVGESTAYTGPIEINESLTLRVKAHLDGSVDSVASAGYTIDSAVTFDRSSLQYWLRADQVVADAAGRVYRWQNSAGTSFGGTALSDLPQRPLWFPSSIAGRPALKFDGVDDGLAIDYDLEVERPSTVFIVYKCPEGATGKTLSGNSGQSWAFGLVGYGSGLTMAGSDVRYGAEAEAEHTYIATAVQNPESSFYYLNGENLTWNPNAATNPGRLVVGGAVRGPGGSTTRTSARLSGGFSEATNAEIAEVMVFNAALTDHERQEVEGYLNARYGGVYTPKVTAPRVSPSSGFYAAPVEVTLTTPTPGARIYYSITDEIELPDTEPAAGENILLYTAPITISASKTLRVRAYANGASASQVAEGRFEIGGGQPPIDLDGMLLWLRADTGATRDPATGHVSAWADLSGHGNDALQTLDIEKEPIWSSDGIGSRPVVHFDGIDDGLATGGSFNLGRPATVFLVYQPEESGGRALSGLDNEWALGNFGGDVAFSAGERVGSGALNVSQAYCVSAVQRGSAGAEFYVNGVDATEPNAATLTAGRLVLGGGGGAFNYPGNVKIAEVIVYNRALSKVERMAVEGYLAARYDNFFEPTLPEPAISPASGRYADPVTVTLASDTDIPGVSIWYTLDGSVPSNDAHVSSTSIEYTGPFVVSDVKDVSARAFLAGVAPSGTSRQRYEIGGAGPAISTVGLKLWLRADGPVSTDAAGRVTNWHDMSSNGYDATVAGLKQRPVFVAQSENGAPALHFDGVDDGMVVDPRLYVSRPATVFVAYTRPDDNGPFGQTLQSNSNLYWSLGLNSGSEGLMVGGYWVGYDNPLPAGTSSVAAAILDEGQSSYFLNGANLTSALQLSGDAGNLALGGGAGDYYEPGKADIMEVIVYDRVMTDGERQQIEAYLAAKYSTHVPLVSAPVFTPPSGTYPTGELNITMASTTIGATIRYTTNPETPEAEWTTYSGPVPISTTTHFKARAFAVGYDPSPIVERVYFIAPASPEISTNGLQLWLRADSALTTDAAGRIANWGDLSGHGFDAYQNRDNRRPVVVPNAMNGQPVMRFESVDIRMPIDSLTLGRPSTVFLVHRANAELGNGVLLGSTSDTHTWLLGPYRDLLGFFSRPYNPEDYPGGDWDTAQVGRSYISSVVQTPEAHEFFLSGASNSTGSSYGDFSVSLALNDSRRWGGNNNHDIAEVIAYDRALSETERYQVESYLSDRYGIQMAANAPAISPPGGPFNGTSVKVSLTSLTAGASIFYTTDGTDPINEETASSHLYVGPFTLTSDAIVKARAFHAVRTPSTITSKEFFVGQHPQTILRERYENIAGATVQTLLDSPKYPGAPDHRDFLGSFQTLDWNLGYYGNRLRGYIFPPMSGEYVFSIASDDNSELFLSVDDDPANKVKIASVPVAVSQGNYGQHPQQRSARIVLEGGRGYYIEVLHKKESYWPPGHLSVKWQLPDQTEESPIPGSRLKPFGLDDTPTPVITPRGGVYTASLNATISSAAGASVFYTLDGSEPSLETGTPYTGPISITANAQVKARAFKEGFTPSNVASEHYYIDPSITFNPAGFRLWLRADLPETLSRDGGNFVTEWADQSGLPNRARQDVPENRPTWIPNQLNGLPVVRFNPVQGNYMIFDDQVLSSQEFSIVVIGKAKYNSDGYREFFSNWRSSSPWASVYFGNDASGNLRFTDEFIPAGTFASDAYSVFVAVNSSEDARTYVNGKLAAAKGGPLSPRNFAPPYYLGKQGELFDEYLNGDIAEMLVFDRALTPSDQIAIEGYAKAKYNLGIDLQSPLIAPNGGLHVGPVTVSLQNAVPSAVIHYTLNGGEPTAASPIYSGPFQVSTEVTVKARAFADGYGVSPVTEATFSFDPATTFTRDHLLLWLRADQGLSSNEQQVSAWKDLSGSGTMSATQDIEGARPLVGTVGGNLNGQPALNFDGGDYLKLPPGFHDFTQGLTAIVVARPNGVANYQRFVELGNGPSNSNIVFSRRDTSEAFQYTVINGDVTVGEFVVPGAINLDADQIFTTVHTFAGVASVYKNGPLLRSEDLPLPSRVTRGLNYIGASSWGDPGYQGAIAEVLLFNKALSTLERSAVETYLRARYGIHVGTVAGPAFSPAPGFYISPLDVSLSTTTEDASIYYTLDGSEPTNASSSTCFLYGGPIGLIKSATIKAKAFHEGLNESVTTSAFYAVGDAAGAGDGLSAEYFDNGDLSGTTVRRTDQTVDFAWNYGSPDQLIDAETFSARWTGTVLARFSEAHVFHVTSDDGVRLWVDNQLVIDDWTSHGEYKSSSAPVMLTRGQQYSIRLEYYDQGGYARVALGWSSASLTEQIIPQAQLFSGLPFANTVGTPVITPRGGIFSGPKLATITAQNDGAAIYYTLNGTEPTVQSSPYMGPISISSTSVIRAVSFLDGKNPSGIAEAHFTIDQSGPVLANLTFNGASVAGSTIARTGTFSVSATDSAGVSRVEFWLDGNLLGSDGDPMNVSDYTLAFNPDSVTDGAHTLEVKAYDSLSTLNSLTASFTVALAVLEPPVVLSPADNAIFATPEITITGVSTPGKPVHLFQNSVLVPGTFTAGVDGSFSIPVTLVEGATPPHLNTFYAKALNRAGASAASATRTYTLDTAIPLAPDRVRIAARESGKINLSWDVPPGRPVKGYNVYRADHSFSDKAAVGVTKLNSAPLGSTSTVDAPATDGTFYYRITSVGPSDLESLLSNEVFGRCDKTGPQITSIQWTPKGAYDQATGRFGQGRVDVAVTVSEELQFAPFFSLVPSGGSPIPIVLQLGGDGKYTGTFEIRSNTPSGTARASASMRDQVGNRGTVIAANETVLIDTAGPEITALTIEPAIAIKNEPPDSGHPVVVTLTAQLSSAIKTGTVPKFYYSLSSSAVAPVEITNVQPTLEAWTATFALPLTAGQGGPETLRITFQAVDDLDNLGTRIVPKSTFEVYQGALPGLDSPLGLVARSLPAGKIDLQWRSVGEAADYEIYWRLKGSTDVWQVMRSGGAIHLVHDLFGQGIADGEYEYQVAAIRKVGAEESLGDLSNAASAISDHVPPQAPTGLTLSVRATGIHAQWDLPDSEAEPVTYLIYRDVNAAVPSGPNDSPILRDINGVSAVDPAPTGTQRFYVVVAVDSVGNRSGASVEQHHNVDLLPVQNLQVNLTQGVQGARPVISWNAVPAATAGYEILGGAPGSSLPLTNPSPTTATSVTDGGYDQGDRQYLVTAIDNLNQASATRTITLPRVSASLRTDTKIERGFMNRLVYTVQNDSTVEGGIQHVRIQTVVAGHVHSSGEFSLSRGETKEIPVVVGGYTDLAAGTAAIQNQIVITPNPGEMVTIQSAQQVAVFDGKYVMSVTSTDPVRGGSAEVQFKLLNTSSEEIELLTANGFGAETSSQVRFKLIDEAGNTLSSKPLKMTSGVGIVTLPQGQTVARIPAGQEFTSGPVTLPIPETAPMRVAIQIEIDEIHYHLDQADGVTLAGMSAKRATSLIETPYTGEVITVSPENSNGTSDIVISGRAFKREDGAFAPGAPLLLKVVNEGSERTISVTTDSSGNFSYSYKPASTERGGVYSTWVTHPDVNAGVMQKQFTITRLLLNPTGMHVVLPRGYTHNVTIAATAGTGTAVSGLHLEYRDEDQPNGVKPAGLTVNLGSSINLNSGGRGVLSFALNSNGIRNGSIFLRAISDGTADWGKIRIDYEFRQTAPILDYPDSISVGVKPEDTTAYPFRLRNKGLAPVEGVKLSLLDAASNLPAPAWATIASAKEIDAIPADDGKTLTDINTAEVALNFAPPANTPLADYYFTLRVEAANHPKIDIPVRVVLTAKENGRVLFHLIDLFTSRNDFIGTNLGVAGATVVLQNTSVTSQIFTFTSNEFGDAEPKTPGGDVMELPIGQYRVEITAPGHQLYTGSIWIRRDVVTAEEITLLVSFVTVEWKVVPTTIQDRYEVILNATFTTSVPAPVVTLTPGVANIPELCAGQVYVGEAELTNQGLVRTEALNLTMPKSDDYFRFEMLTELPSHLEARETVRLRYRVTCIKGLPDNCPSSPNGTIGSNPGDLVVIGGPNDNPDDPQDPDGPGGDGETPATGCFVSYQACMKVTTGAYCVNGTWFPTTADHCLMYLKRRPCGGPSYGGTYGHFGWCVGCPAGGEPRPAIPWVTGVGTAGGRVNNPCTPEPDEKDDDCNSDNKSEGGSWVHNVKREYIDNAVDFVIRAPNGAITVTREFDGNGEFLHEETNEASNQTVIYTWLGYKWRFPMLERLYSYNEFGFAMGGDIPYQTLSMIRYLGRRYTRDKDGNFVHGQTKLLSVAGGGYKYIEPDGTWRLFNGSGYPISFGVHQMTVGTFENAGETPSGIIDVTGTKIATLHWSGGELQSIEDIAGRKVSYTYKHLPDNDVIKGAYIESVTDVEDKVSTYSYEKNTEIPEKWKVGMPGWWQTCRLVSKTLPDQGETTISYDPDVVFLVAGSGGSTFTTTSTPSSSSILGISSYHPVPAVKSLNHTTGGLTRKFNYRYDTEKQEYYTEIRHPDGRVEERYFDASGRLLQTFMNGFLIQEISYTDTSKVTVDAPGRATTEIFDSLGNTVSVTTPEGGTTSMAYRFESSEPSKITGPDGLVTQYKYDARHNIKQVFLAPGTPDEKVFMMEYHPTLPLATSVTEVHPTDANKSIKVQFSYDDRGRIDEITDAIGNKSKILAYHPENPDQPYRMRDRRGHIWQFEYTKKNLIKTVTTPLGYTKSYEYNERQQITKLTDQGGKSLNFVYDDRGNLLSTTGPGGRALNFEYDAADRLIRGTDEDGLGTQRVYDSMGRLKALIDSVNSTSFEHEPGNSHFPDPGPNAWVTRVNMPKAGFPNFGQKMTRSSFGDVIREEDTNPEGESSHGVSYEYDAAGRIQAYTDEENRTTRYQYDIHGQLTLEQKPTGEYVRYGYDRFGNMEAYTIGKVGAPEKTWTYTYDKRHLKLSERSPRQFETRFKYNEEENLIEIVRPSGKMVRYDYDEDDQLSEITTYTAENSENAVRTVAFTYWPRGEIKTYDDGTTSGSFTYDDYGNKLTETINYDGFSLAHSYTYNRRGLKETYAAPDGTVYRYDYDAADRLMSVSIPGQGQITYNNYGRGGPRLVRTPGGGTINLSYDRYDRLRTILSESAGGADRLSISYQHTPGGRIAQKVRNGVTEDYDYDGVNRVLSDGAGSYTYDWAGNRLTSPGHSTPALYDGVAPAYQGDNRLLNDGKSIFAYDDDGNQTTKSNVDGTWNYEYDEQGHLTAVRNGSMLVATYAYDPWGRRVWKEINGGQRTYYHYADEGLVGEYDANGTELKAYGYEPGAWWTADPMFLKQGNAYYWYVNDHNGTPQALLSSSGVLAWSGVYATFGQCVVEMEAVVSNLRFPGQYFDAESGLHYNWQRYYDPETGRYLSVDPKQDGTNWYVYALSNPLAYTDPSGEFVPLLVLAIRFIVVPMIVGAIGDWIIDNLIPCKYRKLARALMFVVDMINIVRALKHIVPKLLGLVAKGAKALVEGGLKALARNGGFKGMMNALKDALCKTGLPFCFAAGTPVLGSDGPAPIETVKVGDSVWSWDEDSGMTCLRKVKQVFARYAPVLLSVQLASGQVIETTPEHPFWVVVPDESEVFILGEWRKAGDLKPGDSLCSLEDADATVKSIERKGGGIVYNLEVEESHTYSVGTQGVLVHNSCSSDARKLAKNLAREGRGVVSGQAAAHLVPSNGFMGRWAPGAKARALLDRYGVGVNDAANGIALGEPRPHNYTHRTQFIQRVSTRLQDVANDMKANGSGANAIRSALRNELRSIGRAVQQELAGGAPGPGAFWTAP